MLSRRGLFGLLGGAATAAVLPKPFGVPIATDTAIPASVLGWGVSDYVYLAPSLDIVPRMRVWHVSPVFTPGDRFFLNGEALECIWGGPSDVADENADGPPDYVRAV